ncbi:MAG: RecX family transcriptional regulator [Leptospiraceae bacterium]|nr:RecX family transcriptional regulator [Leptospiraceae bacterium]
MAGHLIQHNYDGSMSPLFDEGPSIEVLQQVWPRLQQWLAWRERSSAELFRFLGDRLQLAASEVEQVGNHVLESGLIDDERFANGRIAWRRSKGKGPWWIRQDLRQAGIQRELAESLLNAVDDTEWLAGAMPRARQKYQQLQARETDEQTRQNKLRQFLQARGFDPGTIKAVYDKLCAEAREQD